MPPYRRLISLFQRIELFSPTGIQPVKFTAACQPSRPVAPVW